jgi:hypothetical protein
MPTALPEVGHVAVKLPLKETPATFIESID